MTLRRVLLAAVLTGLLLGVAGQRLAGTAPGTSGTAAKSVR
ncbi:hypothetical protein ACFWMQ_03030 [Streptomyces sp. NPDC058372]